MCVLLPSGETRNYINIRKEQSRLWDRSLGVDYHIGLFPPCDIGQKDRNLLMTYRVWYFPNMVADSVCMAIVLSTFCLSSSFLDTWGHNQKFFFLFHLLFPVFFFSCQSWSSSFPSFFSCWSSFSFDYHLCNCCYGTCSFFL